jgi:trk/ktr system potassium uptake protein
LQTLIAGGGGVGFRVATYLSDHGEDVIIIDEDRARCDWLSKNSDAAVYHGNILDAGLLMEAGIDKVDSLVTALGNDETTLKLVDFAKSQFGVPRIIAITKSPEISDKVSDSGADKVICSEEVVLKEVEGTLHVDRRKTIYSDKKRDFEITKVRIKATSKALGRNSSELWPPKDSSDAAVVFRGDNFLFTSKDEIQLQLGDEVLLMGNDRVVDRLIRDIED